MVKDTAGYHSGLVTPSTGNGALLKMFLINRDSSVEHLDASQTRHYCTDKTPAIKVVLKVIGKYDGKYQRSIGTLMLGFRH